MTALALALLGGALLMVRVPVTAARFRLARARIDRKADQRPDRHTGEGRTLLRFGSGWDADACGVPLRTTLTRPSGVLAGALSGALAGTVAGGPVVGVATASAVAVLVWLTGRRVVTTQQRRDMSCLVEALGALIGELHAGRSASEALHTAAGSAAGGPAGSDGGTGGVGLRAAPERWGRSSAGGRVSGVLSRAAATAGLGGDVSAALRDCGPDTHRSVRAAFERIAAGWQVSETSGGSLAAALGQVEADLRANMEHSRRVSAQLAGPRATAALLAALPALGLLLGAGIGSRPLDVLFDSTVGQAALLVGVLLDCAGVVWMAYLVRDRTVLP